MVTDSRWRAAQRYERGYWDASAAGIAAGTQPALDWYAWRAERLLGWLRQAGRNDLTDGGTRVVEIGSGPIGIVAFFPASVRVAVDPLAAHYARHPALVALRTPGVEYRDGVGEALPCSSAAYDLAIIDNCIDHVRDVDSVMREIARVLHPEGVLYLSVNCRTPWGFVVHRILSRLLLDPGHPHTFTPRRTRKLLARKAFDIVWSEVESARLARRADLTAATMRACAKGVLGTSEFTAHVLARRGTSPAAARAR